VNISDTKRDRAMDWLLVNLNRKLGVPASEYAVRFATGSPVLLFVRKATGVSLSKLCGLTGQLSFRPIRDDTLFTNTCRRAVGIIQITCFTYS